MSEVKIPSSETERQSWPLILGGALAAGCGLGLVIWLRKRRQEQLVSQTLQSLDDESKHTPGVGLNGFGTRSFKLVSKTTVTHNTRLFRFALPSPAHSLGLAVGHHVNVHAKINADTEIRSYTPITSIDTLGFFDLLIKVYEKGLVTNYLDALTPGAMVEFSGPHGSYKHGSHGAKSIGLICGGTGITPMFSVIQSELANTAPDAVKHLSLLFANISVDDILLRDEIDSLAKKHSDRMNVFYTVDQAPPAQHHWTQGVGRLSEQNLRDHLKAPSADNLILLCGPPGFMNAMAKTLLSIGHDQKNIIKFGFN